jgi:hypothetical protein
MDGENRARLKDAIDKPTPRAGVSAGKEMPTGILGAPIAENPHGHVSHDRISPDARARLSSLAPEQAGRMRDFLKR